MSTISKIEQVDPLLIKKYLVNKKWIKITNKREDIEIYFTDQPQPTEILLPLSKEYSDYSELMIKAIVTIAKNENQEVENVLFEISPNEMCVKDFIITALVSIAVVSLIEIFI